jgi:hypothetical protein
MNPVSGVSPALGSDIGIAVMKKLLDSSASSAQTLIAKCLDPMIGHNVDLHL